MQQYSKLCPIVAAAKVKLLNLIKTGTIDEVRAANLEFIKAIRDFHQRHAN